MDLLIILWYKFIMKRIVLVLGLLSFNVSAYAEQLVLPEGFTNKDGVEIPKVSVEQKTSLLMSDEEYLSEIIGLQREKDLEDIEKLWDGTVNNNQVISFALKKLATPESQRRIHSSLMSKTLSAMVAGASFAPMMLGQNYMLQSGAFAAGRLAQNLINKKNIPQEIPLTDTEMIELAGLIENLQDTLISTYYNYKNSLTQLKETRTKLLLYSKNYSNALEREDLLEITISSSLYESLLIDEFYHLENAKKYHLALQRLAGKKIVEELNLVQFNNNVLLEKRGGKR